MSRAVVAAALVLVAVEARAASFTVAIGYNGVVSSGREVAPLCGTPTTTPSPCHALVGARSGRALVPADPLFSDPDTVRSQRAGSRGGTAHPVAGGAA